MLYIKIKGLEKLQANVDELIKSRIPKMTAIALTATAKALRDETKEEMKRRFDRPNPWTLGGVFYMSANTSGQQAYVYFKGDGALGARSNTKGSGTPAGKYLWPEVHGGPRNLKGFERILRDKGLLPAGYYAVPGEGVRLDRYGNIPRQMIVKILSAAKVMEYKAGYNMDQTTRSRRRNPGAFTIFVGRPGHDGILRRGRDYTPPGRYPLGIWERSPYHGLIPLLIFVKAPQYKIRFPFYDCGNAFVDKEFPKIFKKVATDTLAYWNSKRSS